MGDQEREVALRIQKFLQAYGISSELVPISPTRANLVVEIGGEGPVHVWSGHLDVVAAGPAGNWQTPPFELTEQNGRLYGRGVADMKGSVAAMVLALVQLKEEGALSHSRLRLLLTADEETGQAGAKALYDQGYMKEAASLFITEPVTGGVIYSHKGSVNFKLTSRGKMVHSSIPEEGYNAIEPLAWAVGRLQAYAESLPVQLPEAGRPVLNCTVFKAGEQINSLPDLAEAYFNGRPVTQADHEAMLAKAEELVQEANEDGAQLELTVLGEVSPVVTTGASSLVALTEKLAKQYLGRDISALWSPGACDAASLLPGKPADFPFAVYGFADGNMAHRVDEYCVKADYLKYPEFLVALMKGLQEEDLAKPVEV